MAIAKAKAKKKQRLRARVRTPIADANAEYRAGFQAWAKSDAARSAKPSTTAGVQPPSLAAGLIALEHLPEGVALTRANHALRAALDAAVQTYALLANRATKNAEQVLNRGDGP